MYVNRNYGFWMTLNWSKRPLIVGLMYGFLTHGLLYFFELQFSLPWQPISLIGIAVAFYLGFKNNSSYDRTWEARKIWGGIVNSSRAFGAGVVAFIKEKGKPDLKRELIYRHIAWLTALRYQLRKPKGWEHVSKRYKHKNIPTARENDFEKMTEDLEAYLNSSELERLKEVANPATQILAIQSRRLQELRDQEHFEDFRHMEFHHHITSFYTDQGKAERIKNFPFPRQYASTALWLTFVFCAFVPFGMVNVFQEYPGWMYWLSPVLSGLIIWVFFLMEKIGDYSENPFEGTYNDVPITNIATGIEIDLREMIEDSNVPAPTEADRGFLM